MAESEISHDRQGQRDKLWEPPGVPGIPQTVQAGWFKRHTGKEPGNQFDSNAIRIVVHIHPISKKTIIGYIPKGLARELSKVIDTGVEVKAKLLDIIGGYGHKETLGTLVNFSI